MIVSQYSFVETLRILAKEEFLGADCETTGLLESDRLFSLIISTDKTEYYFNFMHFDDAPDHLVLPRNWFKNLQEQLFSCPKKTWFISKAKFDMRMLHYEDCTLLGTVHCILAQERVIYNAHMPGCYNLKWLSTHYGYEPKSDKAMEYMDKHKLFVEQKIPGKKKVYKKYMFHKVPFEIMSTYAMHDARLHYDIGRDQCKWASEFSPHPKAPSHKIVWENEKRLVHTCFRMERTGIRINREYTEKALAYENIQIEEATNAFKEATGIEFNDGRTCLVEAFTLLNEPYPKTEKGNPSFTEEVLEGMTTPVASMVNRIRKHTKRAGTYYASFLHYADSENIIHADFLQEGAETGRFSCRDPNLQNVPKEDEPEDRGIPYWVRGCFMPRSSDHFLVSLDYSQVEYMMMLDYAGQMDLIQKVLDGFDLHQATADMMGVTRKQAKTLNFAILYGAGDEKLAGMLGINKFEATLLRKKYFAALPQVQKFIESVRQTGRERGFVFNCFGRRLHITSPEFSYVLPNHIIQGSSADAVKIAMNRVDDILKKFRRSYMVATIHDELVFDCHKDELELIPMAKNAMESIYQSRNGLGLSVSCSYSNKSLAVWDMTKGTPV